MAITETERRIATCKEALALIKSGFILPLTGHYVSFDLKKGAKLRAGDLKCQLKSKVDRCQACADGALFVAMVMQYNGQGLTYAAACATEIGPEVKDALANVFNRQQLATIEQAFELWNAENFTMAHGFDRWHVRYVPAATIFGKRYGSPSKRLTAILKNMIKNEGIFRPEQVTTPHRSRRKAA